MAFRFWAESGPRLHTYPNSNKHKKVGHTKRNAGGVSDPRLHAGWETCMIVFGFRCKDSRFCKPPYWCLRLALLCFGPSYYAAWLLKLFEMMALTTARTYIPCNLACGY